MNNKPTYFEMPNFDTPPESRVRLGQIIHNFEDATDVVATPPTDLPPQHVPEVYTSVQSNWQSSRKRLVNGPGGVWTHFLASVLGLGANVSLLHGSEHDDVLKFDRLETSFFEPDLEYVRTAMASPLAVRFYEDRPHAPAFIVTGIKVARGAAVERLKRVKCGVFHINCWLERAYLRVASGLENLGFLIAYKCRIRRWIEELCPESDGELSFQDQSLRKNCALTMVLATDPTSLATPRLFRSYLRGDNFGGTDADTPIWKVALAAIATPLDLDPVVFRGSNGNANYTCIASSLAGLSNPSWTALIEAREGFLPHSVHTVLNIGCGGRFKSRWPERLGHVLPAVRGMALTKVVIGQVNDPKRTAAQMGSHRQMLEESANTSLYYQYFSAATVDNSYYDWSERTRVRIERRTEEYLESPEISGQVHAIGKKLLRLGELEADQHDESITMQDRGLSTRPWLVDFPKTLNVVGRFDKAVVPVKLAVLDTGVDAEHPWICRRWTQGPNRPHFYDFTTTTGTDGTEPVDETGHGTQMAGLILQVAPHVELYVIRVFTDRTFDGAKGKDALERVGKKLKVNIISMSFTFEGPKRNDLDDAITTAMDQNVVMFAAASNSGHRRENPYPASDRRVFRVNAVDENGHSMACNPPAGIDDNNDNLATLGFNLLCPWPMNLPGGRTEEGKEGMWRPSSGTSSATALLSAICALTMDFGRVLRAQREFRSSSREVGEIWRYVDRPQGMRHLFWQMAGGRNNRTWEQFSYVCPWYLVSTEKMRTPTDVSEIGKLYLDALRLGREGMG